MLVPMLLVITPKLLLHPKNFITNVQSSSKATTISDNSAVLDTKLTLAAALLVVRALQPATMALAVKA